MFKPCFQAIWSILVWVKDEGGQGYANHECSTQARCYIITLDSDWSMCHLKADWWEKNHHKVMEGVQ